MKKIILILIFAISLFAVGGWGEPVLVAEPDSGVSVRNCQIAVDHSGVLHVVFTENFSSEYANLKYSQSADGGKTWSTQINLTPDNTTERVEEPRIVIDSENNVHIIFYYLDAVNPIYYLNNTSGSWSDPIFLGIGMTSVPLFEIDQDDRMYIAYFSGQVATGKSYCVYKDKTGTWTTPSSIPGIDSDGRLYDLHSHNSDLYAVGRDYVPTKSESYARLYKYDKNIESWTNAIDISNDSPNSQGKSIYITENNTVHVVIFNGVSLDENVTEYLKGGIDLVTWSKHDSIGYNKNLDKQIFIDRESTPHIFETSSTYYDLLRSSSFNNEGWKSEIIVSDSTSYFDDLNVVFFNGSESYIVYNYNSNIYFQTKIVTGIKNHEGSGVIDDYNLNSYPNPFNNETVIHFNLNEMNDVKLSIFNSRGQLIDLVANTRLNKGNHIYTFKAENNNSGTYFAVLKVGSEREIKKMLYLR